MPTDMPLRSAADGVMLAANHLRPLLGDDPVPTDASLGDAMKRYGPTSGAMQVWFALRAVERFTTVWLAHVTPPDDPAQKAVDAAD